jgi:hypothetical protein
VVATLQHGSRLQLQLHPQFLLRAAAEPQKNDSSAEMLIERQLSRGKGEEIWNQTD